MCLHPAPRKRNTDGNWQLTTMMTAADDDGWCLTHSPGNRRAEIVLGLEKKSIESLIKIHKTGVLEIGGTHFLGRPTAPGLPLPGPIVEPFARCCPG